MIKEGNFPKEKINVNPKLKDIISCSYNLFAFTDHSLH